MKLTTGILFLGMVAGTAWGQNPDIIENTKNTMKAVQQKKAMDSDAALAASQPSAANPPAAPVSSQPAAARQASSKRARSKPVALKVKNSPAHKKQTADRGRKPEQARGSESRRTQAHQFGRTARSLCQSGGQSQHAGFRLQHRQALPDH